MKRSHAFTALVLVLLAAVALAAPARAQTIIYDQQYTGAVDASVNLPAVGDTAGQSFTPTASQMNTVVFDVEVGTNAADPIGQIAVTVAAQLLASDGLGGSVLAQSADVQIASGQQNAGPHVFTFPTTVALTPGTKYTVALTVRSVQGAFTYIELHAQGSDVYGGGQGYSSTGPVGTLDFYFQEGITYPASVTAVHAFSGTDGANPESAPIVGNDGNLYGTTAEVYSGGSGTVYMVSPDGATFTTLHTFNGADGDAPEGGLLQASDGFLYGTTVNSGPNGGGTVFKVSTDGTTFATLHAFGGGVFDGPYGGLIQADDGFLYGTASGDGASGYGTVFAVSTDGTTFRTVYSFSGGNDGGDPECTLVEGLDGNLYGTTIVGGTNDYGVVFMVSRDGQTFTTLHSFDKSDGFYPDAGLLLASDGNLYGTTIDGGGVNDDGTVFMVSTDGTTFKVLHTFNKGDGHALDAGLLQASDGNLYGTAADGGAGNGGTAFMVSPDGTTFNTSYAFSANGDGITPYAGLVQAGDGNFYGAATFGGNSSGDGTVYRLDVTLPDVVQFHASINSVNETAGTATVRVDRIGDDGSISLLLPYTLTDGTAKAGTDYTQSGFGAVYWQRGDVTPKFIPVNIVNRGFTDGSLRTLSLTLGTPVAPLGNGTALGYPGTATLTINGSIPGAPVILHPKTATGTQGTAFVGRIDASASPTSYAASGLPDGLSVNASTGKISGTPTGYGVSNVTLSATNAAGTGTATLTLTVHERKPAITSAATDTAQVGQPYSYQIVATGGTPLTYAVSGLFDGLAVDANTGQITGTPKGSGPHTLTLRATNAAGTTTQTLALTVNPRTPVITSDATVVAMAGQSFSYQIKAQSSPTSFGASGSLDGLSVNTTTGALTGTPTAAGTFSIGLTATNAGGTGQETLTLTVRPVVPVITVNGTATATVGQVFSYQIEATGDPTLYGVGGLFQGFKVDTQTGLITGTPTAAGTHTLQLRARNESGEGTQNLTVTVTR